MNFEILTVFSLLAIAAFWLDMHYHKDNHEISLSEAAKWSIFWIFVAMLFAGYLYVRVGTETASLFLTGYALEKVLSVDNLFVIMAIFTWFRIPNSLRHRVLYWGIIGAIVFRGIFVVIGTSIMNASVYAEIAFAILVAATAVMMLRSGDDDENTDYSNHLAIRITKKFFKVHPNLEGQNFFTRQAGVLMVTPLFLCLAVIELSDVMFAFDSVPAVIAVSKDPIIVYSAMLFAILGLRTLYFVLEALKKYLVHLEKAVIALLFFIAAKIGLNATDHLLGHGMTIDATTSLVVVLITLSLGVLASIAFPEKNEPTK